MRVGITATILFAIILSAGCKSSHIKQIKHLAEEAKQVRTEIESRIVPSRDEPDTTDAIDPALINWCKGSNIVGFAIGYQISNAHLGGIGVDWTGEHPSSFATLVDDCNGAVGFITEIDGKLYGAWSELAYNGLTSHTMNLFKSRDGMTFSAPLEDHQYNPELLYWIFTGDATAAFSAGGNRIRSNITKLEK